MINANPKKTMALMKVKNTTRRMEMWSNRCISEQQDINLNSLEK